MAPGATHKKSVPTPAVVTKYQKHISGTILDRIDIHIEVPRVDYGKPSGHDRVMLKFLVLQICLQAHQGLSYHLIRLLDQQRFRQLNDASLL